MKKTTLWTVGILLGLMLVSPAPQAQAQTRNRNFVLFFEILDYTKEMGDAVSFFFSRVLEPGDQLIIYTPARVYGYSKMTLSRPKRDLYLDMQDKLRADTAVCSTNYKVIMEDMRAQVREIEGGGTGTSDGQAGLKNALTIYRQNLENLKSLRKVNETLLHQIVNMYKTQQGSNQMVMVYQAEFRPIPNRETLNRLRAVPNLSFEALELFASEEQKAPLNAEDFIDLFREVPVSLQFLYIKPKDVSMFQDYREQSTDMYNVFSQIAKATGGIVETTASPEAALKTLVQALQAPAK